MIATALRRAIQQTKGIHPSQGHADLHLNTWWHPLQREMRFGLGEPPRFGIGPGSLAAAGQICIARGGQPNVTLLPDAAGDGLKAYLLAPLEVAHTVLSIVKKRKKREKATRKQRGGSSSSSSGGGGGGECKTNSTPPKIPRSILPSNLPSPQSPSLPGAVIFLHGLGDVSSSWHRRFAPYFTMEKDMFFIQPTAPLQVVTGHATASPIASWFDIHALPLTSKEPEGMVQGLADSIAAIHTLLDRLTSEHNILPANIVLGGFSQGGALAIEAGVCYKQRLAGIVSISGWCSSRNEDRAQEKEMDVFYSSGTSDPVVQYGLSKQSCDGLVRWFGEVGNASKSGGVVRHVVQRGKHSPKGKELKAASAFIQKCLMGVPDDR